MQAEPGVMHVTPARPRASFTVPQGQDSALLTGVTPDGKTAHSLHILYRAHYRPSHFIDEKPCLCV